MSGGYWDYIYYKIEEIGNELDPEINQSQRELGKLLKDLSKVLHDAEWHLSGDYSLEKFNKTWEEFKTKWVKKAQGEK